MLDDMGLIPTLHWHFTRYTSQTGIRVNFQHDEILERVPPEIETTAYRIIQEALTNVARYAQTKEVFVGIAMHEDSLWLEILDKGQGFDTANFMERPSTGLGGMRERASLVGGYVVVESYLNQGTQIIAALPLSGTPIERRKNDRKSPSG
jgi:signal transduction histidine kinase